MVRVGLCNSVPTIIISAKKTDVYLDKEEWKDVSNLASRIVSYFEKRKKANGENQVRFRNIVCSFTVKGRNRVFKIEHGYPWITTFQQNPSPHITITSPSTCFNRNESLKFCSLIEKVNDSLRLLEKLTPIYIQHVNPQEEEIIEPFDLSLNTNTLLNNLFECVK